MHSSTSFAVVASLLTLCSAHPGNKRSHIHARAAAEASHDAQIMAELELAKRSNAGIDLAERTPPADAHVPYSHLYLKRHFQPRPEELTTSFSAPAKQLKARSIAAPVVSSTEWLGPSMQYPTEHYIHDQPHNTLPTLATDLLEPIIQTSLTLDYDIYTGSGTITLTDDNEAYVEPLVDVPSCSRDSGKGGIVAGHRIFVFSDSESYTTTNATTDGKFVSFVSNSVAFDYELSPAMGSPMKIQDHWGAYENNKGALRGFVPFTLGEQAYNEQVTGGRIAIWPSSSVIPLDSTTSLQYAPLVFVNETDGTQFTYFGTTMYTISIPVYASGAVADRVSPLLFPKGQMEWGCLGGIRSWGASGVGGDDGWVYIFTNSATGLYAGRVAVDDITDLDSYEYWYPTTSSWSSTNIPDDSTTESFLTGSYASSDIFYSQLHKTFINVYADRYIDNKFLWRYLEADDELVPAYDGTDFVENIFKYSWSGEQTLYEAPTPPNDGYIYSTGVQIGYFGDDDVVNGGTMMLLSWTSPTGEASSSQDTSYSFSTCVVTWES